MIYCKLVQAGSMPVSADVYRAAATKFWRHEKAWDLNTHEGKAMAATCMIDRTYVKGRLGLCDSCWLLMVSRHTDDNVGDQYCRLNNNYPMG